MIARALPDLFEKKKQSRERNIISSIIRNRDLFKSDIYNIDNALKQLESKVLLLNALFFKEEYGKNTQNRW